MKVEFLTLDDVLRIHEMELARYGGMAGVRDRALLESALAQPTASFGGEALHGDHFAMAAAYLYHIVKNHPFLDGNKRTGLIVALTFLAINGIPIPTVLISYTRRRLVSLQAGLERKNLSSCFAESRHPPRDGAREESLVLRPVRSVSRSSELDIEPVN